MQSMVICYFLFFILIFIFFIIFQYGPYDSHKQTFKSIFKLKLKLYEDNIPILICCNNEIFIVFFFVFKRVLIFLMPVNVLQWCAGIGIFYYCAHAVIMNKFSNSNCFPKIRCVIPYLIIFSAL